MNADSLETHSLDTQIREYQSKLLPYAYNIVGDFMEAEDIVQDILNKYFLLPNEHIENPKNYLIRSVINRSINHKKLLRSKKELYPGEWLPTPVFTEESIYSKTDSEKILNYSLLVLMENLNPKERAVFILKEMFEYSHQEIAETLDLRVDHSRQILKRSKEKLKSEGHKSLKINSKNNDSLSRLTEAIQQTDMQKIKELLSGDIQLISDGGPKVSAARNILRGVGRVSKLLNAVFTKYWPEEASYSFTTLNHRPAILFLQKGQVFRCMILEEKNNEITNIYIVVNPDKLKALNFSH